MGVTRDDDVCPPRDATTTADLFLRFFSRNDDDTKIIIIIIIIIVVDGEKSERDDETRTKNQRRVGVRRRGKGHRDPEKCRRNQEIHPKTNRDWYYRDRSNLFRRRGHVPSDGASRSRTTRRKMERYVRALSQGKPEASVLYFHGIFARQSVDKRNR